MHPIRPECHPRPMLPTFPVGPRFSQPATMMTGPNMYNVPQQIRPPVHLNSHAGFHNSQQLPHQWPVQNVLGPHPQQMMRAPSGMMMTPGAPQMVPVGFMNGEILFEQVHPLMSTAPPQNLFTTINTRKTEHVRERPYIKKPPNAFMLFANKYREVVTMQLEKRDSASVHVALGKMWKLLPQADRDKYYEEADAQKRRHAQLYPRWSTCENYGKRRKRRKSKIHTGVSKDTPDTEVPHGNSMCLSTVQKDIMVSEELDSSSETMHYNSQPPSALDSEESVEALIEEKKFVQMPCGKNELSIAPDVQTQGEILENDHALNLLDCMLLSPASQIELQSVEDGFQLLLEHFEPQGLPLLTEAEEYTKPLSLGESQQLIIKLFEGPALTGNLKVETQLDLAVQGHTVAAGPSKPLNKPIQLALEHLDTKEDIQPRLIAHCQTLEAESLKQDVLNQVPLGLLETSSSTSLSSKETTQTTPSESKITPVLDPVSPHHHKSESSRLLSQDTEIQATSADFETSAQSPKLASIQSLSKDKLSMPLPHVETLSAASQSRDGDLLQCLSFGDELQF
ncbi:putative transcription factor SOX-14 [Syngnathus acus]|uniref:putative transcription factor SOX-14 n=1 Tax=Syngnathus acus TaxID=161584 RepID=UPI00188626F7|nr:putative transcription factor SOX-14 [Syngnathus acus]XP_037135812.1 putative transcription factor SOX-14 [Syngnathus acus]XP_037135814.1 putative transcription factor SOX-14 [Syngnathus acus]